MEAEVEQMLELKVIKPSVSPYSSFLHLVEKKDGKYIPVVDFLNKVTIFDVEPMPNPNEICLKFCRER